MYYDAATLGSSYNRYLDCGRLRCHFTYLYGKAFPVKFKYQTTDEIIHLSAYSNIFITLS